MRRPPAVSVARASERLRGARPVARRWLLARRPTGESGCLVQHGDEGVGVVREAAEEQAVDAVAEAGEEAGARGPAVDHDAAGAVGVGVDRGAERARHGDDVLVGGGLGGADRPHRLVRDDDRAGGDALEVGGQLLDVRERGGRAVEALGVSPMHSTGVMPWVRAAAAFAAVTLSVSPNRRRRSACPISATATPTSASSAAATSPVYAPGSNSQTRPARRRAPACRRTRRARRESAGRWG